MTRHNHHDLHRTRLVLAVILSILLLSACGDDTEIPVYVTPTSPGTVVADVPPSPAAVTPGGETATATALPPSETPTPGITPSETATYPPGATFGPVVGMGQTPAPSATGAGAPPTASGPFGPVTGPGQTAAPQATQPPSTQDPNAVFGPIVGPDHTLMPTEVRTPVPAAPTAIPTSGPSPTPGPALERDLLGIQIHPHIDSRDFYAALANAHDLGVGWIKYQFNWSLLESSPGQFTDLFYMLRLYVQETHKQGFRVMIGVTKAPLWARAPGADGQKPEDGPPDDPQALASFLSHMLNQIGRDVDGRPYIDAIEVWNEPNLRREWQGRPMTGADYMRYFRPAYEAIRAFSPEIVVISAAPAPTGTSPQSTDDRVWLRQAYGAGLAQYTANVAVGIHPYGWANPPEARCCGGATAGWNESPQFFFLDTLEDYHNIMRSAGHNSQLWVTEFGWATFDGLRTVGGGAPPSPTGSSFFGYINQYQQADYTVRAFAIGQELPYVGPMILWNLNFATLDGAVDQSDQQAGYGLLDNHFQPRPVYTALKQSPKQ